MGPAVAHGETRTQTSQTATAQHPVFSRGGEVQAKLAHLPILQLSKGQQ